MFYARSADIQPHLRFGDIVKGFILGTANIEKPSTERVNFTIGIDQDKFFAVLTPCCDIGGQRILLVPLEQINSNYYKVPYWEADLTRLNRAMMPKNAFPPRHWAAMDQEEKEIKLAQGNAYAHINLFIYAPHDLLPKYKNSIKEDEGHYQIYFTNIQKVNCTAILSTKKSPANTKLLQLSKDTRQELREKLSKFFQRPPPEDL